MSDTSTKIKVQINSEADFEALLKSHPEIEVTLSEKVIAKLATKLKDDIGKQAAEILSNVIWTQKSDSSWVNPRCAIVLVPDSKVPGGFRFALNSDTQGVLATEARRLIRDQMTDEIRRQCYTELKEIYADAAKAAAEKAVADLDLDTLKSRVEGDIMASIAECTAKSLVSVMLKNRVD